MIRIILVHQSQENMHAALARFLESVGLLSSVAASIVTGTGIKRREFAAGEQPIYESQAMYMLHTAGATSFKPKE